ncbi:MAG: hypothetical protein QXR59_02335 [Candidatus Bathyarchaeia archaeon]
MSKSVESITKGFDISIKNPILFLPYAVPIIIQLIFNVLAYLIFPIRLYYYFEMPNPYIILLGSLVSSILGFIAACMLVDMANDVISGRPIDLRGSLNLVITKFGTLIVAAIIAALCSITVVLLPIALFIVIIAIIEETGAIESVKRSFDFVIKNIGETIILIIIIIVVSAIFSVGFSYIPIVGPYISAIIGWIINAIFTVVTVYFYLSLRPPPPPPPPPPEEPQFQPPTPPI